MDWVDEEFMIVNATMMADFAAIPEAMQEEVNLDTVTTCSEEKMAAMMENPEMTAQMQARLFKSKYKD